MRDKAAPVPDLDRRSIGDLSSMLDGRGIVSEFEDFGWSMNVVIGVKPEKTIRLHSPNPLRSGLRCNGIRVFLAALGCPQNEARYFRTRNTNVGDSVPLGRANPLPCQLESARHYFIGVGRKRRAVGEVRNLVIHDTALERATRCSGVGTRAQPYFSG